ncbi:MAG: FeoB-associated Cys-rich membrane protein [Lachnospiraceae bacterium]|nr:FeoB-associated Cys-rich membrane protein [Lachnospiraceae bacterium]
MPDLLAQNLGTVLITLLLILIVAAIIASIVKDRKQGKSSCGGNCAHCKMCAACKKK